MKSSMHRLGESVVLTALLCGCLVCPEQLWAEAPVKMKSFAGTLDFRSAGPTPFTLEGQASHLGNFTSVGEVVFSPGREADTQIGVGVAVFRAANGDLLVGHMVWSISAAVQGERTAAIQFRWSDSITLSNGTVVTNTGRFVDDRPAGLVIDAKVEQGIRILIAILGPILRK